MAKRFNSAKLTSEPPKVDEFQGNFRYCSLAAHYCVEPGRVDDLWALLYIIMEFAKNSFPWSNERDKDKICVIKQDMHNLRLVAGLPHEFRYFFVHLYDLRYPDVPNYSYLKELLISLLSRLKRTIESPYDWEPKDALPPGILSGQPLPPCSPAEAPPIPPRPPPDKYHTYNTPFFAYYSIQNKRPYVLMPLR